MSSLSAKCLLIVASIIAANQSIWARSIDLPATDLIYGVDNRYEVEDYADLDFIQKARSVAIRISSRKLTENREDPASYNFPARKLKQLIPQICLTERFVDEVSVGDCSGFLIAPNKLVTAGHCMIGPNECASNKWVFDFHEGVKTFSKSNVYSCKSIIAQKYSYTAKEVNDYAVILLDRNVEGRTPLSFRKFGVVDHETPLVVIGHPMGLSQKITDGARVTKMNDIELETRIHSWLLRQNYFTANLDSYGGNSGSPVFNKDTGTVEGILIQGADDFFYNEEKHCLESRHFSDSSKNSYEKVMRITRVPNIN